MDTSTSSPSPLPPAPEAVPAPSFSGRTPSKASAIRAGLVLGMALVVVIGTAVAMGAAPGPSSAGASPQAAAASGSPAPGKGPKGGHGFGHDGFGGLFGGGIGGGKGFGRGFGHVTITAIDGSSLSLATDDGWTRTITLTDATTITRGGSAATASDLKVGGQIRFRQHKNDDGTFSITAIDIVLPQVLGTVTATTDSSITITDRDGAIVTVHVGAATTIRVRGVENATAKDLAAGQVVLVVGERRADGSIDATGILAGKLRGPGRDKEPKPQRSAAPDASDQPG